MSKANNSNSAGPSPLAQFEAAVQVVDSLPRGASSQAVAMQGFKPSTDLMLRFYALYKQAKFGPCKQHRPAFWDLVGKVKWDAWRALGDMPQEQAMIEYCRQLRTVIESLPNASPEVSGLIDKVGSFYRLVDEQEAPSESAGAVSDIKRGLLLANRIRYRSGGSFDDHNGLDVNSNFLTQSLPPPMMSSSMRASEAAVPFKLGNGFIGASQPDLRAHQRDAELPDGVAASAAINPDDNPGSSGGSSSEEDDDDEFCDSYDNFLHPEDEFDDAEATGPSPPGDVTGGGSRQPSASSSPSASAGAAAGSSGRRHTRQQQRSAAYSTLYSNNGGVGENGGDGLLPWQQPPPPPPPVQSGASASSFDLERELVGQLRHIRASLDRLSGDLGRIHSRLDLLERHRSSCASSLISRGGFAWLRRLILGEGGGRDGRSNGGLSLPALLLLLAWPVIFQLLWRLPWHRLRRRRVRLAL